MLRDTHLDKLTEELYRELRSMASLRLYSESVPETASLNTTSLVHEAYDRLAKQNKQVYENRAQFLANAATMMRRVVIDYFRRRKSLKRGLPTESLDDVLETTGELTVRDVLVVEEALEALAKQDERMARLVEYKFYGGMTVPEIVEVMGISSATVKRQWAFAKAWMRRYLEDEMG